jgi:hypothetical protein
MRPNSKTVFRNSIFLDTLTSINPDIIILTETNSIINPGNQYNSISTTPLPELYENIQYQPGENRVTIYSKYPILKQIPTADSHSSVCVEIATPYGPLIIYGTIIGSLGGLLDPFKSDLEKQTADLTKISQLGNTCFCGDLNISFSGRPYPSKIVQQKVSDLFDQLSLTNLTKDFNESALHTVFSILYLENRKVNADIQPFDKKITDHSLINVSIE